MSAATLLALGQQFAAAQFPATVIIAGHTYTDASTTGIKHDQDLMAGGWSQKRQKSFWLPVASFAAASKPVPVERDSLTHGSNVWVIARTNIDPSGTNISLHCESPDQ